MESGQPSPARRMRPSEVLTAFATAKARAARQATSRIVEFVNAADHSARVSSAVPLHRPLFEAVPAEVWIDEYAPFQPVVVRLTFRNCDAVARRLRIEPVHSPFFRVAPCARPLDKLDGKVAAGMELAFMLEFLPQQVDDYAIDLVCCTERERFLLPVRVRGRCAALDIPDRISFGLCPVRLLTSKTLMVRNIGTRGAKFAFRISDDRVFSVSPVSVALEQGQAVQIELRMTPPSLLETQGVLEITDDGGTTAVVELSGTVENIDVYLSQPVAEPSATYLSLSSRRTVKICNESEFTLDFCWKSFADAAGDEQERDRLLEQLARMEALELEQLQQDALDSEQSVALSPSPFDAHKALETKYKHLRKAVMEEEMQFVDDCFAVTPLRGRVWAHSEADIVVSFTPMTEMLYSSTAYLEVAGQEHRLPLQIRGQGIGPKAKVVYNELLDLGDVFISDERTRDFTIQNKGEIPANFHLVELHDEPRFSMRVIPESGTLEINEMRKIEVTFCSQHLGEVSETIRFALHGSSDLLTVRFKANVIPPVFHFDTELIDFGPVSYSFPQSRTLKLVNASKIAMKYLLRIPEEANYRHKEMELVPSQGKLSAFGEEEICINFTPLHVKTYEYQLVVGVPGVGTDLLSIPLRAQSLVPEVVIDRPDLDFGSCFLRYPHKQTLVIENRSASLFGRYEIAEQDDHSRAIATYNANEFNGVVPPGNKVEVTLQLACEKIGSIRLPMTVSVLGSTDLPLAVTLTATGCGPKVDLDQPEIHWGSCACLVDHERVLRMTNSSLIPAAYKTFIKNARSKFQVDKKDGLLQPGESVELVLTANLDDTILFKDQLYILVAEGDNLTVPLSIRGTGTTMWSPTEMRVIDFGHQMTHRVCEWSCTLENKGKRVQVLTWVNKTVAAAAANRSQAGVGLSKKLGVTTMSRSNGNAGRQGRSAAGSGNQDPSDSGSLVPVFSVFPGTIELKPRTACVFVFKGLSSVAGIIQEDLVCETRVGKEKANRVAFVTQIRGVFVDPKLEASSPSLKFEYTHHPGNEIVRQSQPLTLTNVCELPLSFTLRTQTPFSLDCWEATLEPREQVEFNVEFYPGYKEDYTCRVISGKVLVVFTEHPQKDSVDLVGDISFPNLSFETTKVDFGCTLNDTQKTVSMTVTNVSKVDTNFRWIFIDDDKETPAGKKAPIPINQVFDILPIRGLLKPGESEKVEFIYYGHANRKFRSVVACEVDGGPEYEIVLLGEASSLVYKLDKQSLDFGQVLFNKLEDRDFSIMNVGKVPFAFSIAAERISRGRLVEVTPSSGRVAPGEKARVIVRLRPGVPEPFEETLVLEIAHFQPFEFKLFGLGTFSSVTFNLPRESHSSSTVDGVAPNWTALKKRARKLIEVSALKMVDVEPAAVKGLALTGAESKSSIGTTATRAVDKGTTAVSALSSFGSPPASPSRTAARQAGGAPPIDEVDIETEACRLFFSEYLIAQEMKKADSAARKALPPVDSSADPTPVAEPAKSSAVAPIEVVTAGDRAKPSRRREPLTFTFVLSQFVLDFGNIVLGTHKVKKFSITNIGQVPVSFQLDKNLAGSSGFQIEPERVVRLPEKHAVEFAVTFQARKNIDMGFYEVQLPVTVKNGPPCLLTLRATVTVPDVSISIDTLDFGRTVVGTCHTMYTQLQNVSAVTAEWAFKKPMGSARDVANFRFTPQSGVLTPGNKVNVRIEFVPDDGRHFMLKLPIKVASNPKTRSIVCRGEGAELRLAFQPQLVDLGPVLPCSPPVRQTVAITNDSDYPIEVFSLDFDPVYKEDEELLRSVDAYSPEGLLQLPVRTPGQPLKAYMRENGFLPLENAETALPEQIARHELGEDSGLSHGTPSGAIQLDDADSSAPRLPNNVLPVLRRSLSAVDYIVVGPPQCGNSTQALLLAEKENFCVWSIDEAIRAVCMSEVELGATTRSALQLREKPVAQQKQEQELSTTALSVASSSASNLPKDSETTQENEAEPELPLATRTLSLEVLLPRIVAWRLSQPDMQRGSVLDGLQSAFASPETVLASCSKAFVGTRVILLSYDEDAYDAMMAAAHSKSRTTLNGQVSPQTRSKESLRSTQSRETIGRENNQLLRSDSEQPTEPIEPTEPAEDVTQSESREDLMGDSDAPVDNNTELPTDAVEDLPTLGSVSEQFDALLHLNSGISSSPLSFPEYAPILEELRLLLFGRSLPEEPKKTSSDPESGAEEARVEPTPSDSIREQDSGLKDALVIEIPITEVGEALFIHNMVYAAIEKRVRELESQSLVLPTSATFQLIRRPPERFSRKPVPCFSIAAVSPTPPESAKDAVATADEGGLATPNGSRPQTPSATPARSRPSTASAQRDRASVSVSGEESPESKSSPSVPTNSYRWVIAPRASVNVEVQFTSSEVGVFDCSLGFEIVGGNRREFTLFGRGTCSVPTINSDPRSVFMSRVKSRPEGAFVHKKFVLSLGQFEFGPLIVSNRSLRAPQTVQDFVEWKKASPSNIEAFRLSNNSRFPLHLDIGLAGVGRSEFVAYPSSLSVGEGETGEVLVWANPATNGVHESSLVCCIQDNPEPVIFPITCYGCTPRLELRGPWEQPAATSTSEIEDRSSIDGDQQSSSRSGVEEEIFPVLDFEKLLIKHQEDKTFFIENVSPINVAWRLQTEGAPDDFRFSPVEGIVKPLQKTPILVEFSATSEAVHRFKLQLEYSDADSALAVEERRHSVPFVICGEAYKIDVCSFEESTDGSGDGRLEFGLVRVGEKHTRSFTIRNRGKYNIKHVISCRTSSAREFFAIEPSETVLEPDQVSTVSVTFQSKREVVLHDCKDIKCVIIEMISGEPCREFFVFTSAHSVFSKFRLQPNRGINFGPNRFNDQAKSKRVEIRNDGDFPFKFRVSPNTSQDPEELTIDTPLHSAPLSIGQFTVTPSCGTVDPGATAALDIVFQPKESAVYFEVVRIDISGRRVDDIDADKTLLYELVGESCYPGINTSDFDSIFEEQIVVRSMDFDSVPAGITVSKSHRGVLAPQGVVFAEKEKVFSFGAVIAAASAKGSVERFKISNPTKISSTVSFQVTPKSGGSSANGSASDVALQHVFTVQPSMWEIPPLEHRFVSVYFRPPTIATFHATFAAVVEDSPPSSTPSSDASGLQFELRGEGTLPCVSISSPSQRDSSGALLLNFGRVRVSKAKDLPLELRNDGILAATVLFSTQPNPSFLFALGNGSIVLAPRATETLLVQFRPLKAHDDPLTSLLKVSVQNNLFEETTIKLIGSGYKEDLVLEDLPGGRDDDELHFNDVQLPASREQSAEIHPVRDTQVFSLWNQTDDILRFEFPRDRPFSFRPSVGHLPPRAHKMITASFEPASGPDAKATIYRSHPVSLRYQRIAYKASTPTLPPSDWDDTVQTVSFDNPDTPDAGSTATSVAEPEHTQLAQSATLSLSCFAAADVIAFESDTSSITFRRTFMLQVCAHRIAVRNKSKIRLPFSWRWERPTSQSQESLLPVTSLGGTAGVDDECPFVIDPADGVVPPEQTQEFVVKFAPMEVDDYCYLLQLETPSVDGAASSPLHVEVRGTSLRPACHFDVERSDYAQRRTLNLPGPFGELGALDPSVKVIEMESLGVRVRNTRRFYVVNPTNVSYEFSWVAQGEPNACFRCATPKGLMLAGKRCEMIFEFTPQQLELQEMFWYFRIPHFQVNQLFLFVGTTVEPRVTLDRGSVNFNTLLIGSKATQSVSLINHEHIPFNFVLDKSSLDFAGETPALVVHPLSGVIAPNSRATIEIEFIPTEEKAYNFNINCIIKRKPTRLSLNVKGEGYSIHDGLTISSGDQSESQAVSLGSPNLLDFGLIRVNEEVQRTVAIQNNGKFNFEFNWSSSRQPAAISIEPMQGTIKKNDRATCKIVFAPTKQASLDGAQIACTVAGSKIYSFVLQGGAVPPSIQFSFTSHDFGPCFVADPDASPVPEVATLSVTNMDAEASIDLDCLFEKKPHLRVDCPPTSLGPRESVSIPIVFVARQETSYLEMVPFSVNGPTTINVSIRGEGTLPRVELVNSSMQTVSFGNLQIGQQLSRTVKIVNRSKRRTVAQLEDNPQPGAASLVDMGISVLPQREVVLRTKESADVEFRFSPTQRIPSFQKDIFVNVAGCRKKLLTLAGCCQGIEVVLETDTLSFGAVCLGSQLVRKVRLQNRGDIPSKFHWNALEFAPDFSIAPVEGVVAPNHHKTLEVAFQPAAVNPDIRYDRLQCSIEGATPVTLTLVGSCVDQAPSSIQDIHFSSRVREATTKSVIVENRTATAWNLLPVVQGEHWSCQESVLVPATGSASLDVVYLPLRMTRQGTEEAADADRPETHEGSIFLATPDGSALLYNVFGKAGPPAVVGALSFSTPAKKTLHISIPVKNWLRSPQVFQVDIQSAEANEATVVQGAASIALQGSATKSYSVKFFSYIEGTTALCVRLVNQDTSEYMMYDVKVAVTKAAEVETLHLDAPVRQSVKKLITIENPLGPERAVHFANSSQWWKCSHPCVRVTQLSGLGGRSEGCFEIEYRPLLHSPAPVEAHLSITFAELGDFAYKLVLSTQPATTERTLYFKVPLGAAQTQAFEFVSFADQPSELASTVHNAGSFNVPPALKLEAASDWEGRTQSVPVKFEPEAIGEVRDVLVLQSPAAGEYRCALHGVATPPLPQGPFVFSGAIDLEFKNVFSAPMEFDVVSDNPRVVVAARTISIPAKTTRPIAVRVDASAGAGASGGAKAAPGSLTAKLLVSCPTMKELPPWVFYLEAQVPAVQ